MKFEIDLVKDETPQIEQPEDGKPPRWGDTNSIRMGVRNMSDDIMRKSLVEGDVGTLQTNIALLMLIMGKLAYSHRVEPEINDFVDASQALVEDARSVLDRGLMLNDPERTKSGIVMMEIVMRGIAAALGFDYETMLRNTHAEFPSTEKLNRTDDDNEATTH